MKARVRIRNGTGATLGRFSTEGEIEEAMDRMGEWFQAFDRESLRGQAVTISLTLEGTAEESDRVLPT